MGIIWKVSLVIIGMMALCILCCCFFVFVVKVFCNKQQRAQYTNTNTMQCEPLPETATLHEAESEQLAETNVGIKKQQRGKSLDHYHVRVAVDEEEENGLTKTTKRKKGGRRLKKRIKVEDDDDEVNEEENIAHPLFDRKCRSNSF